MDIIINKGYNIIKEVELINLPDFIVITGENGTGKTQFLNYLYCSITKNYLSSSMATPIMHDYFLYEQGIPIYDEYGIMIGNKELAEIKIDNSVIKNIVYREIQAPSVDVGTNYNVNALLSEGQNLSFKYLSFINYVEIYGETDININKLNSTYEEAIGVVNKSDSKLNIKLITEDDINLIKKIINIHGIINFNLIPYFYIAYKSNPYSNLFSTNIRFLYIQYWAKLKAGIELPEAPWITFNRIAKVAKFRYKLEAPNFDSNNNKFDINLIDSELNIRISNLDYLSSGEKVILSLVLAVYSSNIGSTFPQVIFFDEPDAYLHPSLCKEMLDVLQEVLVKDNNIKIIMTTHSPTTVALSPELSLYRMDRKLGHIVKTSKKEAIKTLTNGLNSISIYYENIKQVFVEAPLDKFFLENIYTLIQNQYEDFLESDIILQFITAGNKPEEDGCEKVKKIVNTLTKAGNNTISGIIDWDLKNDGCKNIYVLGNKNRYSIENYIFDPIGIALFILSENENKEKIGFSNNDTIVNFYKKAQEDIQLIIDTIISLLKANYNGDETNSYIIYQTLNNMEFLVPEWLLKIRGHNLVELYLNTFPFLKKYRNLERLIIDKCYRVYPQYIQKDILQTLQAIQKTEL